MFRQKLEAGSKPDRSASVIMAIERLRNASFVSDKRDILLELKKYSETARHDIVQNGMPVLMKALRTQPRDDSVSQPILEILLDLLSDSPAADASVSAEAQIACRSLLAEASNVPVLLDHLKSATLWVKLSAIGVLTSLLRRDAATMSTALQRSRIGVSSILEILSDPREEVRNEVLALLSLTTEASPELRDIVAFDDGFERLLGVVSVALTEKPDVAEHEMVSDDDEEDEDGERDEGARSRFKTGRDSPSLKLQSLVLVADCLTIVLNVLRGSSVSHRLFIEGRHLRACVSVLDLPARLREAQGKPAVEGTGTPALAQHVRLCLLLFVGIIDELVQSRAAMREWQSRAGGEAALSPVDAAVMLAQSHAVHGSVRAHADAVAAVPGLLEGLCGAAFSCGNAGSPELTGAALMGIAGIASASEAARKMLADTLCHDPDVDVLDGVLSRRAAEDGIDVPGFSLFIACTARASVASESRLVRDGAGMLLHAVHLQCSAGRTALFAHALAPPPVPLPNFLVPVALQQTSRRYSAASLSVTALEPSDVMATVAPAGRVLLAAAISSLQGVSSRDASGAVGAALVRPSMRALASSTQAIAVAVAPGIVVEGSVLADTSAAELFMLIPVSRVLPGRDKFLGPDIPVSSALLHALGDFLRSGRTAGPTDEVATALLCRPMLACTLNCPSSAATVWKEAGRDITVGLHSSREAWFGRVAAAALAASCWLYGVVPDADGSDGKDRSRQQAIREAAFSGTRSKVESDIGPGAVEHIIGLLRMGMAHSWVAAATAKTPIRAKCGPEMASNGEPSRSKGADEGVFAVDTHYAVMLAQLLLEMEAAHGSQPAGPGGAPAGGAAAAPVAAVHNSHAALHHRAVETQGELVSSTHAEALPQGAPGFAQMDSQMESERVQWTVERREWEAAVVERDAYIRSQADDIAALQAQVQAHSSAGEPPLSLPADAMSRDEAESLVAEWRTAVAERDAALASLQGQNAAIKGERDVALRQLADVQNSAVNPEKSTEEAHHYLQAQMSRLRDEVTNYETHLHDAGQAAGFAQAEIQRLQTELYHAASRSHAAHPQPTAEAVTNTQTLHRRLAEAEAMAVAASSRADSYAAETAAAYSRATDAESRAGSLEQDLSGTATALAQLTTCMEGAEAHVAALTADRTHMAQRAHAAAREHAQLLALLAVRDEERTLLRTALMRCGREEDVHAVEQFAEAAMQGVEGALGGAAVAGQAFHAAPPSAFPSPLPALRPAPVTPQHQHALQEHPWHELGLQAVDHHASTDASGAVSLVPPFPPMSPPHEVIFRPFADVLSVGGGAGSGGDEGVGGLDASTATSRARGNDRTPPLQDVPLWSAEALYHQQGQQQVRITQPQDASSFFGTLVAPSSMVGHEQKKEDEGFFDVVLDGQAAAARAASIGQDDRHGSAYSQQYHAQYPGAVLGAVSHGATSSASSSSPMSSHGYAQVQVMHGDAQGETQGQPQRQFSQPYQNYAGYQSYDSSAPSAKGQGGGITESEPSQGTVPVNTSGEVAASDFFAQDQNEYNSGPRSGDSGGVNDTPFPLFSFVAGLASNVAKSVVNEAKSVVNEVAKAQQAGTLGKQMQPLLQSLGSLALGGATRDDDDDGKREAEGYNGYGYGGSGSVPPQFTGSYSHGGPAHAASELHYQQPGASGWEAAAPAPPSWTGTFTSNPNPPSSAPVALQPLFYAHPMTTGQGFGQGFGQADTQSLAVGAPPFFAGGSQQSAYSATSLQPYGGTLYKGKTRVAGATGGQMPRRGSGGNGGAPFGGNSVPWQAQ